MLLQIMARSSFPRVLGVDNVQRVTIEPIIRKFVKVGSTVYTDKYNIYNWLSATYVHSAVNHGKGEYARDDDGKHAVHVNTMDGF